MTAQFLSEKFTAASSYAKYVLTGTAEHQRRWQQVYEQAHLDQRQATLVGGFVRQMKVLVISGIWCGDCVQQCPLIARIAEVSPKIDLRFVDRDANRDLADIFHINGGDRVPVAIFMAEDFERCSTFGDRTLNRYRALALKQLGAACPTGLLGPDKEELAMTLQDWLDEFERVQLMLRLSARLRQKHGD